MSQDLMQKIEQDLTLLCEDFKSKGVSELDISLGKHYEAHVKNKFTLLLPYDYQKNIVSFTISPTENPYESQLPTQRLKETIDKVEKFKEDYAFQTSETESDIISSKPKTKPQEPAKSKQQNPKLEIDLSIQGLPPKNAIQFLKNIGSVKSLIKENPMKELMTMLDAQPADSEINFIFELGADIFTQIDHKCTQMMRYISYFESVRKERTGSNSIFIYAFVTSCEAERWNSIENLNDVKKFSQTLNKEEEKEGKVLMQGSESLPPSTAKKSQSQESKGGTLETSFKYYETSGRRSFLTGMMIVKVQAMKLVKLYSLSQISS